MREQQVNVIWLSGLLLICSYAYANANDIILNDTNNDDSGNGSLIYPQRHDFQSGDLDLITLTMSQQADGIWFKADFKNSIRDPAKVTTDSGPEPLSDFARKGFYNFNIDIYLDQDRVSGSGNIFTLPGRHASIAADNAWERAAIVTPRPEQMRGLLVDELQTRHPAFTLEQIRDKINALIYFPDQIKVRGKSISFFVPQQYLGTAQPDQWAVTAFVTGAQT
ncbi:MAG TPA: glucodextranase DOMON-like domain-containing protein, partial [Gammaproteobacteria bacterium]|nr:glucodextranase DOMON-like domain-containing protein [Gammaproteobacteria bacterium]